MPTLAPIRPRRLTLSTLPVTLKVWTYLLPTQYHASRTHTQGAIAYLFHSGSIPSGSRIASEAGSQASGPRQRVTTLTAGNAAHTCDRKGDSQRIPWTPGLTDHPFTTSDSAWTLPPPSNRHPSATPSAPLLPFGGKGAGSVVMSRNFQSMVKTFHTINTD